MIVSLNESEKYEVSEGTMTFESFRMYVYANSGNVLGHEDFSEFPTEEQQIASIIKYEGAYGEITKIISVGVLPFSSDNDDDTVPTITIPCTNYFLSKHFILRGAIEMRNGCCPGEPVLITQTKDTSRGTFYSCQCACGGWCTNGHTSIGEAVAEYEKMSQ